MNSTISNQPSIINKFYTNFVRDKNFIYAKLEAIEKTSPSIEEKIRDIDSFLLDNEERYQIARNFDFTNGKLTLTWPKTENKDQKNIGQGNTFIFNLNGIKLSGRQESEKDDIKYAFRQVICKNSQAIPDNLSVEEIHHLCSFINLPSDSSKKNRYNIFEYLPVLIKFSRHASSLCSVEDDEEKPETMQDDKPFSEVVRNLWQQRYQQPDDIISSNGNDSSSTDSTPDAASKPNMLAIISKKLEFISRVDGIDHLPQLALALIGGNSVSTLSSSFACNIVVLPLLVAITIGAISEKKTEKENAMQSIEHISTLLNFITKNGEDNKDIPKSISKFSSYIKICKEKKSIALLPFALKRLKEDLEKELHEMVNNDTNLSDEVKNTTKQKIDKFIQELSILMTEANKHYSSHFSLSFLVAGNIITPIAAIVEIVEVVLQVAGHIPSIVISVTSWAAGILGVINAVALAIFAIQQLSAGCKEIKQLFKDLRAARTCAEKARIKKEIRNVIVTKLLVGVLLLTGQILLAVSSMLTIVGVPYIIPVVIALAGILLIFLNTIVFIVGKYSDKKGGGKSSPKEEKPLQEIEAQALPQTPSEPIQLTSA